MSDPNQAGLPDNAAGAIAYVTFIPAIVFLVWSPFKENPYVRFHAWQSILLNAAAVIINLFLSLALAFSMVFGEFFLLTAVRIVWLTWFVLWLICVLRALNGQRFRLPLLGDVAEKQAER